MAKIIVNTENFATEKVVAEIQAAASVAHPNNAAEVIRDTNGKVVKVLVNLPDDTPSQGIANAMAKIEANLGVSASVILPPPPPPETVPGFEGYNDGQVLLSTSNYTSVPLLFTGTKATMDTTVYGVTAPVTATVTTVNSISGSKSLLFDGNEADFETMSCTRRLIATPSDNGLSTITSFRLKLTAKSLVDAFYTAHQYPGYPLQAAWFYIQFPYSNIFVRCGNNLGSWQLCIGSPNAGALAGFGNQDASVGTVFDYSINSAGIATLQITANGGTWIVDTLPNGGFTGIYPGSAGAAITTMGTNNAMPSMIDNVEMYILDGTL